MNFTTAADADAHPQPHLPVNLLDVQLSR